MKKSFILKEVWDYRQMLYRLVRKDLRTRYKGSILGFLWTFLNPLFQLVVYTFVFKVVLQNPTPNYSMFLFVALVPWIFMSSSIIGGSVSILANKNLIQKVYFPRMIIPLSTTCSAFMNMLFSMVVVFVALLITGVGFSPVILLLPFIMVLEFIFALGLALIVSCLDIYFRDMEQIVTIGTMAWQFLTPVMYSLENIPAQYQQYFYLNPMTPVILAYRDILFYQKVPQFSTLGMTVLYALAALVLGILLFQRLQRGFAEEV